MIISVTGLAGSGKTTAVNLLKKVDKRVNVIDADKIGHSLLDKKEIKNRLIGDFGKGILIKNKKINRKRLGEIVFKTKDNLKRLNQTVHPYLIKEIRNKIQKSKFNVIDAALFYELRLENLSNKIILIKTKKELILKRNKSNKNLKNILKSQRLIKGCDYIIANNGGKLDLYAKIKTLYSKLKN